MTSKYLESDLKAYRAICSLIGLAVLSCSSSLPSSQTPATSAVLPELSPISPAVPQSSPLSDVVPSRAYCEPSPSGREDPVALPPASVLVSPPRPVALTPPPALLPPSMSAGTYELSASRSFLGPSALPGSDVASPAKQTSIALRPSTPTAPAISALPQASPLPSVAPATPQPSGSLHPSRGVVAAAPSRSSGSLASIHSISPPSAPWVPHPSSPATSLDHKVALKLSPPWLLPPAPPPWSTILAGDWVTTWLILQFKRPPPEPPPASSSISPLRPPPEPPPALPFGCSITARGCALPEGDVLSQSQAQSPAPALHFLASLPFLTCTRSPITGTCKSSPFISSP
ncbi:hypothetical protein DPX16_12213 [Anabarilius grahami]|uniref:Uncharacterized protein n=1 Tax=Anabarilius grahami TaxID=495550 RepID=A0A3N0YQX0_ANAGA|nr:hypothetical protein DPX16_12213 [Anabarilius grahami]